MRLRKKSDFPPATLTNDSTNSLWASPAHDSSLLQEDGKDLLPTESELVPLIPEKVPDELKNKCNSDCLVWLTVFLVLGFGSFILSLPLLVSCASKGKKDIKSYVGGAFLVPATNLNSKLDKDEMTTVSILCEATSPGNIRPANPILQNGVPTCGSDSRDLSRGYK